MQNCLAVHSSQGSFRCDDAHDGDDDACDEDDDDDDDGYA